MGKEDLSLVGRVLNEVVGFLFLIFCCIIWRIWLFFFIFYLYIVVDLLYRDTEGKDIFYRSVGIEKYVGNYL